MYGPTIKQIREDKSLSLKSAYVGICSKTNAIKFEHGERTLAADKFSQLLDNLMINMDEFLWALNDYRPQTESYQQYMISRSWNAAKIHEFETNVNAVETSDLNIERVQLASYRLLRDFESGSALNKVEVQLVNEYFTNLSAWSLSDLKFFANNCYVLPYQRMNVLLREAMAARKRYLFFPGSDAIIATVLTNSIDRMIDASDFANANNAIADLKELSNEITMAGYQLLAIYYTAKIEYLSTSKATGRKKLELIKSTSIMLNENQLTKEINELLEK